METGGTLEALEGEDAPAPETSVEPEVPEEVPVIDLSPCTVCDTVPFTSELRRDNHYNSQTHRDAVRKAERRRAREEEAIAAAEVDEGLAESTDPIIQDEYDDVAARRMADAEDSDEEGHPSRASAPVPDHLQAAFDANPFCIPSCDEWIVSGLTDDQTVWFDRPAARRRDRNLPCGLQPAVAGARVCRPSDRCGHPGQARSLTDETTGGATGGSI